MADKSKDAGLFGWKNWSIPDDWTAVKRDRTPAHPEAGKFDLDSNHSMSNMPGAGDQLTREDYYNPVRNPQLSIGYELMKTWQTPLKNIFTEMGAYVMSSQVQQMTKTSL